VCLVGSGRTEQHDIGVLSDVATFGKLAHGGLGYEVLESEIEVINGLAIRERGELEQRLLTPDLSSSGLLFE
jgi:hypothetical protein